MPYLSREDIEKIADRVVCQYKKAYVPERHMCYMVEATELAEMFAMLIAGALHAPATMISMTAAGMSLTTWRMSK